MLKITLCVNRTTIFFHCRMVSKEKEMKKLVLAVLVAHNSFTRDTERRICLNVDLVDHANKGIFQSNLRLFFSKYNLAKHCLDLLVRVTLSSWFIFFPEENRNVSPFSSDIHSNSCSSLSSQMVGFLINFDGKAYFI